MIRTALLIFSHVHSVISIIFFSTDVSLYNVLLQTTVFSLVTFDTSHLKALADLACKRSTVKI